MSRSFQAPEELREAIDKLATDKQIKMGEELFHRGDPVKGVFFVRSGRVHLTVGGQGASWTVEPGAVLGLPATVREMPYSLTATAIEDTVVSHAGHKEIRELLAANPHLCFQVVTMLSDELQWLRFNE